MVECLSQSVCVCVCVSVPGEFCHLCDIELCPKNIKFWGPNKSKLSKKIRESWPPTEMLGLSQRPQASHSVFAEMQVPHYLTDSIKYKWKLKGYVPVIYQNIGKTGNFGICNNIA